MTPPFQSNGSLTKSVLHSPIVIGGVGGSGTRLVTGILQNAGLQLGTYLNKALDNMHFVYATEFSPAFITWPYQKIAQHFDLFIALQLNYGWSIKTVQTLLKIQLTRSSMIHPIGGTIRDVRHIILRARRLKLTLTPGIPWGWKNPRSHLLLPALNTYFPHCKYIHVIRHGLDMAFSKNVKQLTLYGKNFDIDPNGSQDTLPARQLEFWIRSNRKALTYCNEHLQGRSFVLNYDTLCTNPLQVLPQLLKFCGLACDDALVQHLSEFIAPTSSNRYQFFSLNQFSKEQLEAVRSFGFEIK